MRSPPLATYIAGTGTPVLLLHGLGGNADQSFGLLPADADYMRIAPEMPGHGHTDLLEGEPLNFRTFAVHTADCLDALRTKGGIPSRPLPVVGVSMGAGVALALANYRPGLVASLTLVRPSWADTAPPPHLTAFIEASWIPGADYGQLPVKTLDASQHTAVLQDRVRQHIGGVSTHE
ncbi:alpha/beta fold hydrolase [Rhodococcus sp. NPDC049939]|uniref:alpha/beta fold hydrolase n=1 Tax=Rhodococcus sp. NPDC049939 TaxID=3155511 RepID=UPI00340E21C5